MTDSHCRDIGDYDALVIVQQAGFEEGELLLYERLQMTPMLLERYANEGSEKSRRQMIAMCKADPEILADVLGHLVSIATQKMKNVSNYLSFDGNSITPATSYRAFLLSSLTDHLRTMNSTMKLCMTSWMIYRKH